MEKIKIKSKIIERHRENWAEFARERNWYTEPFYIQIWVNKKGEILDSVSHREMKQDIICSYSEDKELKPEEYEIV